MLGKPIAYDLIVIYELGYLPISQPDGQLLFQLISNIYKNTSLLVTTNHFPVPARQMQGCGEAPGGSSSI